MLSQGCARFVWWSSLLPAPSRTIHVFPPDGRLHHQVWWHILYTEERGSRERGRKGRNREKRRRTKSKTERRKKARKLEWETKRERETNTVAFLSSPAYCVILATVAATTAGIIIISKGRQNTDPESHNAEFYDFWHRGDATGCNATFYALLTASPLSWYHVREDERLFETSCPTVVGFVVAVSKANTKMSTNKKYRNAKTKHCRAKDWKQMESENRENYLFADVVTTS